MRKFDVVFLVKWILYIYIYTRYCNHSDLLGHLVYVPILLYLLCELTQRALKIW